MLRPSPSADGLRAAFRRTVPRTQRRSDGTFTLDGVRYEIPSRFRTLRELTVRYARGALSLVELYDPRTGLAQCRVFPIDKVANADGHRRRVDPSPAHLAAPPEAAEVGIAPYLRELIGRYAATGLLPGYLPTPHAHDPHRLRERRERAGGEGRRPPAQACRGQASAAQSLPGPRPGTRWNQDHRGRSRARHDHD